MDQQNDKYITFVDKASDIVLSEPKLVIKESTAENGGNGASNRGVFAEELIPKGTIFCKSDPFDVSENVISRYINDLLYQGDAEKYKENELKCNTTNIGYVRIKEESSSMDFFRRSKKTCYCIALVDIMCGQELSRYYGEDYWFNYEFDIKHNISDLSCNNYPSDYIFLDEYRIDIMFNTCIYIFVKCVDGKYFYVCGHNIPNTYYTRINAFNALPLFKDTLEATTYIEKVFGEDDVSPDNSEYYSPGKHVKKEFYDFKFLIDCSKPDFSPYSQSEPILYSYPRGDDPIGHYYSTKSLQSRETKYFDSIVERDEYHDSLPKEERDKYNYEITFKECVKIL